MKVKNLSVTYGKRTVLSDLNFEIERGKILAVLGESGTGKTSLLNAIAGLLPHGGSVEGAGECAYLFQSPALLPNLTVAGNLKLVLKEELWVKIPDMLSRVGLQGREKSYPKQLSGGEQQRVAIARAFLFPSDTLLMDEPFSSLDLKIKSALISLVAKLWEEEQKTVIFVTHDVREAVLLSHRAIVLKDGKIGADIPLDYPLPRDFFAQMKEEQQLIQTLMQ